MPPCRPCPCPLHRSGQHRSGRPDAHRRGPARADHLDPRLKRQPRHDPGQPHHSGRHRLGPGDGRHQPHHGHCPACHRDRHRFHRWGAVLPAEAPCRQKALPVRGICAPAPRPPPTKRQGPPRPVGSRADGVATGNRRMTARGNFLLERHDDFKNASLPYAEGIRLARQRR